MTTPRFTMRRTGAIVLCLAATAMFATSCGGNASKKKSADGATETEQTETKAPKGVKVTAIPKDKITVMVGSTDSEKQAAIAEIPKELLKTIGKLTYCHIQSSGTLPGYKYTLVIRTSNEDGKADLEELVNYYKSIGATVEKSKDIFSDYDVSLDYAKSLEVSSPGSYIQVQFSVVKQ